MEPVAVRKGPSDENLFNWSNLANRDKLLATGAPVKGSHMIGNAPIRIQASTTSVTRQSSQSLADSYESSSITM